jgi:hypothetical protein
VKLKTLPWPRTVATQPAAATRAILSIMVFGSMQEIRSATTRLVDRKHIKRLDIGVCQSDQLNSASSRSKPGRQSALFQRPWELTGGAIASCHWVCNQAEDVSPVSYKATDRDEAEARLRLLPQNRYHGLLWMLGKEWPPNWIGLFPLTELVSI